MQKLYSLFSIFILTLGTFLLNAQGTDCETAYNYNIDQIEEFQFLEEQQSLFIDFVANDTTLFLQIGSNNELEPIDILNKISVFQKDDCNNPNLVIEKTSSTNNPAHHIMIENLTSGEEYFVVLERYQGEFPELSFYLLIQKYAKSSCPVSISIPCGELIRNGNFSTTTRSPTTAHFAFQNGEVCYWDQAGLTPDHQVDQQSTPANSYAGIGASTRFNTFTTEAIKQQLASPTNLNDPLTLSFRVRDFHNFGPTVTVADELHFYLVKANDIGIATNGRAYNVIPVGQEIGMVTGAQISTSWTNLSFTRNANDVYDYLVVFITGVGGATTPGTTIHYVNVDDISIRVGNNTIIPDGADISWLKTNVSNGNSTISNTDFTIDGVFTVNQSFTFIDCNFLMSENARINIESDVNYNHNNGPEPPIVMTINNSSTKYIKSCDPNKFWDGIYLEEQGSVPSLDLVITSTNPNTTSVDFQHSYNGINAYKRKTSFAKITLENINFDRNNRCINTFGDISFTFDVGSVNNCHFDCSSPLIDQNNNAYYPEYAIYAKDLGNERTASNFEIVSSSPRRTIFEGKAGGIFLDQSSYNIHGNNLFQNFNNVGNPPGSPQIQNQVITIEASDYLYPHPFPTQIRDSYFLNNEVNVVQNGFYALEVTDNTVNADINNTIVNGIAGSGFIQVTNNQENTKINNNTVYNVKQAIYIDDATDAEVKDNIIDLETQSGINYTSKANNESIGILVRNFNNTTASPLISNNTISHAKVGIQAWFTAATIEDNTILDLNDNTASSGNCAPFGPCPPMPAYGIRALNAGGSFTIESNKVENTLSHYTSAPEANLMVYGISLENTVNANGAASSLHCNKVQGTGEGLRFSGSNEAATDVQKNSMQDHFYGFVLANSGFIGDVGSNGSAADNEWNGNNFGFSETFTDNSNGAGMTMYVQSSSPFDPQISNAHTLNGLPINKDNTGNSASSLPCNARLRVRGGNGNTNGNGNNPQNLGKQLAKGKMNYMQHAADSAVKLNQQLLYWQVNQDSVLLSDSTWLHFADSMKNTSMGRAMGKGNGLSNANNFDWALNSINNIQEKLKNDQLLNLQDSLEIMRIAQLCPYYDGIAVYLARGILTDMAYPAVSNTCEITSVVTSPFKRFRSSRAKELNVFPNPAKSNIQLNYLVENSDLIQFEMYDLLGKKVLSKQLSEGNTHHIELNKVATGMYIYRLMQNNHLLNSGKLVVE